MVFRTIFHQSRATSYRGAVMLRRFIPMHIRSEKAQGLAEYALILALIAVAAVLALLFLSGTLQTILSTIGKKL
jgi:pilus assembly protein Flp/PilA